MPTYTFPTNIAVGDLGQTSWANSVSAALNELGPMVDTKAADNAVVKLTGNQTVAGTKTFSSAPSVPDASFTIAKTSGLQTALNSKITAFADPNADRIVFWDDSASAFAALEVNTDYGLSILGTSLFLTEASSSKHGAIKLATNAQALAGTDAYLGITPASLKAVADTKASSSHTHTASGVVGGIFALNLIPDVPTSKVIGLDAALLNKVSGLNNVTGLWKGTAAQYAAISPKDDNVVYVVTG